MVIFRKGFPIWLALVLAVVPMVLVIGFFVYWMTDIHEYKNFIRELDNSIVFSMHNDCLRAEYEGESFRVLPKNADLIFQEIHGSNYLIIKEETEKDDHIYLNFGDGSEMWLYYCTDESIIMRYSPIDGKEKRFLTEKITRLETFKKLVSIEWGNSYWE